MRWNVQALIVASLASVGLAAAAMAKDRGVAGLAKSAEAPGNPSLSGYAGGVRDPANRRDFALRRLDVEAEVRGAIVEMSLDMQFAGRSGSADLGADLDFQIPVDTAAGNYSGTLTVSLFATD